MKKWKLVLASVVLSILPAIGLNTSKVIAHQHERHREPDLVLSCYNARNLQAPYQFLTICTPKTKYITDTYETFDFVPTDQTYYYSSLQPGVWYYFADHTWRPIAPSQGFRGRHRHRSEHNH